MKSKRRMAHDESRGMRSLEMLMEALVEVVQKKKECWPNGKGSRAVLQERQTAGTKQRLLPRSAPGPKVEIELAHAAGL